MTTANCFEINFRGSCNVARKMQRANDSPAQRLLRLAIMILTTILAAMPVAQAQKAGDLDTSFGTNGSVTIDFGGSFDLPVAIATDSQGRIIVVGQSNFGGSGSHWALVRLTKQGLPDPTFGTIGNGQVLTSIAGSPAAVTVDNLDRVVVVGGINNNIAAGVARFNSDGTLDTTFGPDHSGVVPTDGGSSVAIDSQGRIVVGGVTSSLDGVVARYDGTTGSLDPTFNGTGGLLLPGDTVADVKIYNASGIDGILVEARTATTTSSLLLLDSSGALDPSFGTSGIVSVSASLTTPAAIDRQNRITVAGEIPVVVNNVHTTASALARYISTGQPDLASFCCGGMVQFADISAGGARSLSLDPFGNIVILDNSSLIRFKNDGQVDFLFGFNGEVFLFRGLPSDAFSSLETLAADGDGNVIVSGTLPPDQHQWLLQRFLGKSSQADLKLTKQASATAIAGGTINYSISVTNAGPDAASSVVITDPLPAGATFVPSSCTATSGATCSLTGSTLTISIPTLANTATATVAFQAGVDPTLTDGSVLSNTANIQFNGTNLDPTNTATATTTVINRADLAVSMQQSPAAVLLGQVITYTITLTNNGPADASNVVLNDNQPAGVAFTSCTANGCVLNPTSATANISSLPRGTNVTITITGILVSGADGTVVPNTASVTSATPDPNPANNSATTTFTINNKADVAIGIGVTKLMNRQLSYVISVKNGGPFPAGQLLFNNPIPKGTTFVSASAGAWKCTVPPVAGSGTVTCTLPSLPSGGVQNVTVVVKALSSTTMVTNTATVTAATFDPNTVNNTATLSTKASAN